MPGKPSPPALDTLRGRMEPVSSNESPQTAKIGRARDPNWTNDLRRRSSPNLSELQTSSARAYGTVGLGFHIAERKKWPFWKS